MGDILVTSSIPYPSSGTTAHHQLISAEHQPSRRTWPNWDRLSPHRPYRQLSSYRSQPSGESSTPPFEEGPGTFDHPRENSNSEDDVPTGLPHDLKPYWTGREERGLQRGMDAQPVGVRTEYSAGGGVTGSVGGVYGEGQGREDRGNFAERGALSPYSYGSHTPVPLAGGTSGTSKNQAAFVHKLYSMVEDHAIQNLIAWAPSGDVFSVFNPTEFSRTVLPQYFKHNNWQSFVRQLNMYGFHKVNDMFSSATAGSEVQAWEFQHPSFQRGHPELLQNIKRKSSKNTSANPPSDRLANTPARDIHGPRSEYPPNVGGHRETRQFPAMRQPHQPPESSVRRESLADPYYPPPTATSDIRGGSSHSISPRGVVVPPLHSTSPTMQPTSLSRSAPLPPFPFPPQYPGGPGTLAAIHSHRAAPAQPPPPIMQAPPPQQPSTSFPRRLSTSSGEPERPDSIGRQVASLEGQLRQLADLLYHSQQETLSGRQHTFQVLQILINLVASVLDDKASDRDANVTAHRRYEIEQAQNAVTKLKDDLKNDRQCWPFPMPAGQRGQPFLEDAPPAGMAFRPSGQASGFPPYSRTPHYDHARSYGPGSNMRSPRSPASRDQQTVYSQEAASNSEWRRDPYGYPNSRAYRPRSPESYTPAPMFASSESASRSSYSSPRPSWSAAVQNLPPTVQPSGWTNGGEQRPGSAPLGTGSRPLPSIHNMLNEVPSSHPSGGQKRSRENVMEENGAVPVSPRGSTSSRETRDWGRGPGSAGAAGTSGASSVVKGEGPSVPRLLSPSERSSDRGARPVKQEDDAEAESEEDEQEEVDDLEESASRGEGEGNGNRNDGAQEEGDEESRRKRPRQ